MKSRTPSRAISEAAVRALLDQHGCPTPFHQVRTRFLGSIASPDLSVSPLRVVEDLWGGELPEFASMDDANALIGALVHGLWNDLARHQKRSQPFRLIRLAPGSSPADLARLAQTRREELEGFVEGLFHGEDRIDLPERAHRALTTLGELRAMMAGIEDLVARGVDAEDSEQVEETCRSVRELTRIMEAEMHEAVLSCTRARRQMLAGAPLTRPTRH